MTWEHVSTDREKNGGRRALPLQKSVELIGKHRLKRALFGSFHMTRKDGTSSSSQAHPRKTSCCYMRLDYANPICIVHAPILTHTDTNSPILDHFNKDQFMSLMRLWQADGIKD